MSKGNSRKSNRETKKPKKETQKVLATAGTISNPTQLELGSKKRKQNEAHSDLFNVNNAHFNECSGGKIQSTKIRG